MTDESSTPPTPKSGKTMILPLLPLRDIVLFPESLQALLVGRPRSVVALQCALRMEQAPVAQGIVLAAQKTPRTEEPTTDDINTVACLGIVRSMATLQNNMMKVLVGGIERVKILRYLPASELPGGLPEGIEGDPPFVVEVAPLEHETYDRDDPSVPTLLLRLQELFEEYEQLSKRLPADVANAVAKVNLPERRADVVAGYVPLKSSDKQELLEEMSVPRRLMRLCELVDQECALLRMQNKVRSRLKNKDAAPKTPPAPETQPREPEEAQDEFRNEINDLEARLLAKPLTDEARDKIARELKKLRMMPAMSAEATVVRNYLDWIASLPWRAYSQDRIDIASAEEILDQDHYGLEKVKERILEYLAVQKISDNLRGPILCLVGPPGVGKTSLAKSIARATGREFIRISLGGVRDESEVRGHRRTYIGAMPGKIIAALKRAGTSNPVILLDEIDKMSADMRGDPAAAMLEVLDPEQNHGFVDHYLDLEYDLSKVLFLCTANNVSGISVPLQDRMEMIRLAGYTDLEKHAIARQYLIPKQIEANGLGTFAAIGAANVVVPILDEKNQENQEKPAKANKTGKAAKSSKKKVDLHTRQQLSGATIQFDDAAVNKLINHYTREAGVRNLERDIGTCCRKAAIELLKKINDEDAVQQSKKNQSVLASADQGIVVDAASVHVDGAVDDAEKKATKLDENDEHEEKANKVAPHEHTVIDGAAAADRDATDEYTTSSESAEGEEHAITALPDDKNGITDNPSKQVLRQRLQGLSLRITPQKVRNYLGVERYRRQDKEQENQIGVANGLAWTAVGGEILPVEVVVTPGRGKLSLTGKLGDVMQESAQAALTYVKSRAASLGLIPDFYERIDIHIHVPEGATPKDGPSAGITLATSLVSSLARIAVRHDVAMTGEITLRGRVMPIGGLKEKALAAYRTGCTTVIFPDENRKDIEEIPESVKRKIAFVPVKHVDDVLRIALALEEPDVFFQKLKDTPLVDVFDESSLGRSKRAANTPAAGGDDKTNADSVASVH